MARSKLKAASAEVPKEEAQKGEPAEVVRKTAIEMRLDDVDRKRNLRGKMNFKFHEQVPVTDEEGRGYKFEVFLSQTGVMVIKAWEVPNTIGNISECRTVWRVKKGEAWDTDFMDTLENFLRKSMGVTP